MYSSGVVHMLDCVATCVGVRRRCFHSCFQKRLDGHLPLNLPVNGSLPFGVVAWVVATATGVGQGADFTRPQRHLEGCPLGP
jgi:hypothetical protein